MPNNVFAKRVKELRRTAQISMESLADALDVTKSRVNMWENNGTVPRQEVLVKLAQYFSVSTDYLLGNNDESNLDTENEKLNMLQRNLGKLDEKELAKAEGILKAVFSDIFNDDEDDDDI